MVTVNIVAIVFWSVICCDLGDNVGTIHNGTLLWQCIDHGQLYLTNIFWYRQFGRLEESFTVLLADLGINQ